MKTQISITKHALLILTLLFLASFSSDAAETGAVNRLKNQIAQTLTEKLRTELADQTVIVKVGDLKSREVLSGEMNLDGSALAIVKAEKTELPLEFNAKVNLPGEEVEDVTYKFVESALYVAPTEEDRLTRELIAQIGKDYQTTNVVISIDGFEAHKSAARRTVYEGLGEVRIGDFEWSKIKFNVTIDSQNTKATKILYLIQK